MKNYASLLIIFKNTDIITYKYATAFEAIIGYLYVNKQYDRLDKILELIVKEQ